LLLILVLIFGQERFARRAPFSRALAAERAMKLAVVIYIADWLASKGEKSVM
jgi:hypothetical protein